MRTKPFRLLVVLLAAFSLVAAACGDDDDDTGATDTTAATGGTETTIARAAACGEGNIWVLLPDTATSDRWEKDDRVYFGEAFDAAGLSEGDDYTIVNAEGDPAVQQSQAEQAIADGASVIVLTSNDSGSGASIIDLAKSEGVQVVEYDRLNTEGQGGDVYVSFDNVAVGQRMAEVLEPTIDELGLEQPRVVMLNGGPEDNNSQLFRQGYAETVEARADAGDWTIVADEFVPGWDNQDAQRIMEQILVDSQNGVDAVFAANDGLANSVVNALEAAGLDATTIPLSGQDATQAGIQNILLGKQTMTVYKPIRAEADVAAAAALALRNCEDVTAVEGDFTNLVINNESGNPVDEPAGGNNIPYLALTPIAVTADNIEETVIADGFRTWEEVCTGDVAQFCPEQ
ncbi:MAG: substrate-binding domain-containing protein [Acidimicrobiales bacterium]|nr:substrate-binding domain-containing protein [Acidimicrobiales bacterium]